MVNSANTLKGVVIRNMAQLNKNSCFFLNSKYTKTMKANEARQEPSNEAHKSIDYTKGNIYIARNELIWKTP